MPLVFKEQLPETITIEKEGTQFYFEVDASTRNAMRLSFYINADKDFAEVMLDRFCKCLKGWDNLVDEQGNFIPFSIAVRNALVYNASVFDEADIINVLIPDSKKKTETETNTNLKSISENASKTSLSCTGDQKSAADATTTRAARKKGESADK